MGDKEPDDIDSIESHRGILEQYARLRICNRGLTKTWKITDDILEVNVRLSSFLLPQKN
jgi:hypothetical protein